MSTPPRRDLRSDRRNEAGLLLVALIWGFNFAVVKGALTEIPALAFNALRFPIAALAVWLAMRIGRGVRRPDISDWPALIGLGVLGNVVYQVLFILGLDRTLAGNAGILLATTPVWTALISTLAGHGRSTGQFWAGVTGTLIGAGLVVTGGAAAAASAGGSTLPGDLMILAAAVCWAIYTVGARPLTLRYGSLPVTAWTLWVGAIGTVAVGIPDLRGMSWGAVSSGSWFAVLYAGVLAIGLAYALWYRSVQRIGSSATAIYGNLVPVVALIGGWLLVAETPTPRQLIGVAAILGGISLARGSSPAR